jgi:hypothetical protein
MSGSWRNKRIRRKAERYVGHYRQTRPTTTRRTAAAALKAHLLKEAEQHERQACASYPAAEQS